MKAKPTILGLMGLIAFVAVGLGALRSNNELWAAVVLALTVFALCTASLVAIYRRGAWAGFAVFGWAQFLICQPQSAPPVGPTSLPMGIACRLLPYITPTRSMPPPSFRIGGYPAISSSPDGEPIMFFVFPGGASGFSGYLPVHTLRSGLCLTSLIVGLLGAIVGGSIDRRSITRRASLDDAHPRPTRPS
jgi:hypothetical protein